MPELIPFSSLLEEEEEESGLIPFSTLLDDTNQVQRVPTAMDRGVDLPPDASVAEPQRDLGFWQKTGERLSLGIEQGAFDQEAYNIGKAGGAGRKTI